MRFLAIRNYVCVTLLHNLTSFDSFSNRPEAPLVFARHSDWPSGENYTEMGDSSYDKRHYSIRSHPITKWDRGMISDSELQEELKQYSNRKLLQNCSEERAHPRG